MRKLSAVHPPRPGTWQPIVYVEAPRCPTCGSVRLSVNRTMTQGDGSVLRYVTCECGQRFKTITE